MKYQHLTEGKRYQISALLEQGFPVKNIALTVGCHLGTVYRELKRNTLEEKVYCPEYAHQAYLSRKRHAIKYQIPPERVEFIRLLIEHDWSPEQISGVLTGSEMPVSHEWIYQHIAEDKANGGKLYKHLRQGHKRYRKGKRVKAKAIKNAVSIDDRPAIVDSRERFGDWEIDTVLGKHGTWAIVTLLERKSRFFLIQKVDSKSAQDVAEATINLLKPYKDHVHTITADNGREFANHEAISEALETEFYFAHPYSSWERGANENANGLLRQYVRKGSNIRELGDDVISFAMARINFRPKKCLGFRQPAIIFKEMCMAA